MAKVQEMMQVSLSLSLSLHTHTHTHTLTLTHTHTLTHSLTNKKKQDPQFRAEVERMKAQMMKVLLMCC